MNNTESPTKIILVEVAKGDPENHLTARELESKFLDCAQFVFSRRDAR